MRLVEDDDAVETCPGPGAGVAAEPVDDLLDAANLLAARLGSQCGVGCKQNALGEGDRSTLAEARKRDDVGAVTADRRPVALGILDQLVGFRDPDGLAAAPEPVVEDDCGDLAALAGAGAVAEKPAAAEANSILRVGRCGRNQVIGLVDRVRAGEMRRMCFAGLDNTFELCVGEDAG